MALLSMVVLPRRVARSRKVAQPRRVALLRKTVLLSTVARPKRAAQRRKVEQLKKVAPLRKVALLRRAPFKRVSFAPWNFGNGERGDSCFMLESSLFCFETVHDYALNNGQSKHEAPASGF
jgi:hypothetical protein